jgi:rubredoxin
MTRAACSAGGKSKTMKSYICGSCGWIYDPAEGLPLQDVMPGTPFEELPEDFVCPECGAAKDQFSPIE